jgi:ribosome-associated heat shock protein Hsp15
MTGALRLDKWLWFARFCKSRSLAQRLIERGQATLNGAVVAKPSAVVQAGDRLTIVIGTTKRSVTVTDVADRRGPPAQARSLFEESAPPERLTAEDAAAPLRTYPLRP